MDEIMMDYLERKLRRDRDYEDRRRDERDYDDRRREDRRDYDDGRDYESDSRRGVKGTGRYGIGGSMYRGRRSRDYNDERDYGDERDYNDYGGAKMPKLTKAEKHKWKQMLQNTDGTHGEHYDMQQIMHVADQLGLRFREYDEKDYCLIVNWLYSDYGHVFKKHFPPDKALMIIGEMAAAYFDDPDGPEPDDKMSIQYHCMANPYGRV